jgi:ACR3 family arsenite efflux pump ArsB
MASVVNEGAFEQRSFGKMVLFFIITFGFYGLYWLYSVFNQYAEGLDMDINPTIWTIGLFIPIYNILVLWKFCNASEAVVDDQSGVVLFILYLVFAPAAVYLIQGGINDIAA